MDKLIIVAIVISICYALYIIGNAPQCLFANDPMTCVQVVKLRK